jgi:hypothetical protein
MSLSKIPLTPSMSVITKTFMGLGVWAKVASAQVVSTMAKAMSFPGWIKRKVISFSFTAPLNDSVRDIFATSYERGFVSNNVFGSYLAMIAAEF